MIDEEQVKNIVNKILEKEHLHDFIKIFEKEHNLFRGSHDKITLPENLVVNEKIITQIIQAGFLRDLRDVSLSSPLLHGEVLAYNALIGKWTNQRVEFLFTDNFADDSIFWGWSQDKGEVDLAQKTIQEINGQMLLSVNQNYRAYWDNGYNEAPKVFIGILTYPCEIITRLDETTSPLNENTMAGLFISKAPSAFGGKVHFSIVRGRHGVVNGLAVMKDSFTVLASNDLTDLPVWLRMRIGTDSYNATHVYFDYGFNGVDDWENLYEWDGQIAANMAFSLNPASVGIYVVNGTNLSDGGTKNSIYGKFDFFQMKPSSIG